MARRVKISTISMDYCRVHPNDSNQEAVDKVKRHLKRQLEQVLPDAPDLIVLPEWCDIPHPLAFDYGQRSQYIRERGDEVRDMLAEMARLHHCHIAYPSLLEAGQKDTQGRPHYLNAVQMLDRRGDVIGQYNKNHGVIGEIEEGMLCGKEANLIPCDFGNVTVSICFDLNFDAIRMKYVQAKPDLIIFPSMYHGGLMQSYWAYSCRAYFVGAISGHPSAILNPLGEVVASSTNYYHYVTKTVNLDFVIAHLDYNWEKLSAMPRKYGAGVQVHEPGHLGVVLISSEMEDRTASQLAQEFQMELLDDYFARSIAWQTNPQYIEK